jgi:hypothetical protein
MKNLWKKGLVFGIMVLFLGVSIATIASSMKSLANIKTINVNEDSDMDNNLYVQPGKQLTQKHLVFLKITLPFIKDFKIKQTVQDIITEIIDDGEATSEEIQMIIESNNVDVSKVYILDRVKTTDKTDGFLICFPGLYRMLSGFFLAKGVYANYEWWDSNSDPRATTHGWHLTINNKPVNEGKGNIIGYFGYATYFGMPDPHCPEFYFKLNGVGVLIFHQNL